MVEELLLEVEDLDPPLRADPVGHLEGVVAGPGADLEQALAGLGRQHRAQPLTGDNRVRGFVKPNDSSSSVSFDASTLTKSLIQARSAADDRSLVSNAKPSGRTSASSARS